MNEKKNHKGVQRAVAQKKEERTRSMAIPASALPENGLIYKILWYAVCAFLAFLFLKIAVSKSLQKNESTTSFFDGTYQDAMENGLLKKPFILDLKKMKDEYEFALFDKVNVQGMYAGKKDYIFIEDRTKASFGDDYYGENAIHNEAMKAKYVQTKLNELGIQMLILFAPVKSTTYMSMLPNYVLETKKKTTNYETYAKECKEQGVNFIDFVSYFKTRKAQQPQYPLFSKFGSHWSYYGECIAVDTTIKRMEYLMHVRLRHFHFGDIQLYDTTMVRDADIFRRMPLDLPKGNLLAYPAQMGYDEGTGYTPERVLGIGDSYYRCFFYLGAMQQTFDNGVQWYYNNSIVPEDPNNPEVWQLDLKQEIMKNKGIILMCNEVNLKTLGDGFIDDAYLLFSNPDKYYVDRKLKYALNTQKKEIRDNKPLVSRLDKEAQQLGISLDSLITLDATKAMKENH